MTKLNNKPLPEGAKIKEIYITGKVGMLNHQSNNEMSLGNSSFNREYANDKYEKADGISGDMFKHQAHVHLINIVPEPRETLCINCFREITARCGGKVDIKTKEYKPFTSKDEAIQECPSCDINGFMNVKTGLTRKSVMEISNVFAIDKRMELHHFKTNLNGENPAPRNEITRSGIYAINATINALEIGYSDHSYKYVVDDKERKKRLDYALKSLTRSIFAPKGAKATTNLPYITFIEGIIIINTDFWMSNLGIRAIDKDYMNKIEEYKNTEGIYYYKFRNEKELIDIVEEIASDKYGIKRKYHYKEDDELCKIFDELFKKEKNKK